MGLGEIFEVGVIAPGLGGFFNATIEVLDFFGFGGAGNIEVAVDGGIGDAAVVGGNQEAEIDDIFHPASATGFEADNGGVDAGIGADRERAAELFVVVGEVVDAAAEDVVVVDRLEELLEAGGHAVVAFVDTAGEKIVDIVGFEQFGELFRVGEGEPGALVIDEATLEIENEGIIFDQGEAAVLIGAVLEDLVEFGATMGLEGADGGSGKAVDVLLVILGGKIEFVDDPLFFEVGEDFGIGPGGEVDAVGDGFELDLVAGEVVIVGDASVELGDARAEFGDLDGDGGEADAAVLEFVGEPLFDGGGLEVGKDEALELVVAEVGLGSLDESVISVESVLAGVDYGFVEVHAVAGEFVETGEGGEESGDFVELHDGGFGADEFEGLVAAKAERDLLIETMVAGGLAGVKLAEAGLGDAEDFGGAEGFFNDVKVTLLVISLDGDGIEELEAKVGVVDRGVDGAVNEMAIFAAIGLVWFGGVEGGNENEGDILALGNATSVGGENAEATSATDAVLLVVELNGPVGVGAIFGELLGEMLTVDGGVKLLDIFDVIEAAEFVEEIAHLHKHYYI